MSSEENLMEKVPQSSVEIKWEEGALEQKFVDFEDKDGNYFVFSCPKSEADQHRDMLVIALHHFGIQGSTEMGGGFIKKEGDTITAYGTSMTLENSFNPEKTRAALEKAFPGTKIITG